MREARRTGIRESVKLAEERRAGSESGGRPCLGKSREQHTSLHTHLHTLCPPATKFPKAILQFLSRGSLDSTVLT